MVPGFSPESLIGIKFLRVPCCLTDSHRNHAGNAMNAERMEDDVPEEPVPVMQQVLDNPFLLLFLGIVMPTVLYIVWGVMEILSIPLAK